MVCEHLKTPAEFVEHGLVSINLNLAATGYNFKFGKVFFKKVYIFVVLPKKLPWADIGEF